MFVNTCMIRAGLKIKTRTEFARAYLVLYGGSFLMGGIIAALQSYSKIGSLFFAIVIVGYFVVSYLWEFFVRIQKVTVCQCEVELRFQKRSIFVKGIIDTGNNLCDPITGEPVHILDRKQAITLLGEVSAEKIRYIPYHSIGKREGVLFAVYADNMHVYGANEYWCEKPLIGISEESVSGKGNYELILNPNAF